MTAELAKTDKKEKESVLAFKAGSSYIIHSKMLVSDFATWPIQMKLATLQKLPKQFIKYRKIAGQSFPYLESTKAQRALNFVFNFDVDMEIVESKMEVYKQETNFKDKNGEYKNKISTVYEAMVHARFTFREGAKVIRRDVISTHKSFENSATAHADCYKGAVSKAWTLAAYSFGIGSNIRDEDVEADHPEQERKEQTGQVDKSFMNTSVPY